MFLNHFGMCVFYNMFSFYRLLGSMDSIFKIFGGLGRLWELWGPSGALLGAFRSLSEHFWITLGSILVLFETLGHLWATIWGTLAHFGCQSGQSTKKERFPGEQAVPFGSFVEHVFIKKWVRGECLFSCCVFFNFWWLPGWPNPWSTHAGAVQTLFFMFQVFLKIARKSIKFESILETFFELFQHCWYVFSELDF